MVKGVTRRVIVVKAPDPRLFEQAIFFVKEEALGVDGVSADQVLEEARRVASSYRKKNRPWGRRLARIPGPVYAAVNVALMAILILFALAALIRLAYFNVTEEERQRVEGGVRKYYQGMPVTTVSLIFPFIQLLQYIIPADVTMMYFATAVLCGFAFLVPVQIRKPGLRGILLMVAIGAVEFSLMLLGRLLK